MSVHQINGTLNIRESVEVKEEELEMSKDSKANGENIDTELKEDHVESTCTAINKLESVLDKFKSELKGRERAVVHSDSFDVKDFSHLYKLGQIARPFIDGVTQTFRSCLEENGKGGMAKPNHPGVYVQLSVNIGSVSPADPAEVFLDTSLMQMLYSPIHSDQAHLNYSTVWRWFGNELENFIAPTATLRLSDNGDFWGVTFDSVGSAKPATIQIEDVTESGAPFSLTAVVGTEKFYLLPISSLPNFTDPQCDCDFPSRAAPRGNLIVAFKNTQQCLSKKQLNLWRLCILNQGERENQVLCTTPIVQGPTARCH